MLQHHRHAEATLKFFLDWFSCDPQAFPAAGVRLRVHARYDGDLPADVDVLCEGCGVAAGPALDLNLFNWTAGGYAGYHYDPLFHLGDAVVVADDSVLPAVYGPRRILQRRAAMVGAADEVEREPAASRPRLRVLGRSLTDAFDVQALERAVARLAVSAISSVGGNCGLAQPMQSVELHGATPAVLGVTSGAVADAGVPASAGGVLAEGCAETSSSVPDCQQGSRRGSVPCVLLAQSVSDVKGVDEAKCRARVWRMDKGSKVVFWQCSVGSKLGGFCGRHTDEGRRPQGVWDPPAHVSLPMKKLEEALTKVGARVASSPAVAEVDRGNRQAGAAARSRPSGVRRRRDDDGGGEGVAVRVVEPPALVCGRRQRDVIGRLTEERLAMDAARPEAQRARSERLEAAAREQLEIARGRVLGRLRALQRPVPMNLNRLSRDELNQMYTGLLPRGLRGEDE
jgi:hypothetical protein